MTENSPRGLQAERTRLAWQRSALGAGVVSLLLLYQTAYTGWGVLATAAACVAVAALVLAGAGRGAPAISVAPHRPGPYRPPCWGPWPD